MTSSSILRQQCREEAKTVRRKKKKTNSSLVATTFHELYHLTGEVLGEGAYASVRTCRNVWTDIEYAVKIIDKLPGHSRSRVFKEIEMFHHCHGHKNIIQLIEYFEERERFYLVFEKINGGQLLDHIQNRVKFTEKEACNVVKDLAAALQYLHKKGEANQEALPKKLVRSILTGTHQLVGSRTHQLLEILAGTHQLIIFQKWVCSGTLVCSACSKKGGVFPGMHQLVHRNVDM